MDNCKLPTMSKGEEVDLFIELFESALVVEKVPKEKWLGKLHSALNSETKALVKDTITRVGVTYEEVKDTLLGQTLLSFVAVSEALDSLENQRVDKLPGRQALLKIAKLLKRVAKDAKTEEEIYSYITVAMAIWSLNPEFKQYLDLRGKLDLDSVSNMIGEWETSNPGMSIWDFKKKCPIDRQALRKSQPYVKKSGECYFCGKPGHFAQDCRTTLFKERQSVQENSLEGQVARRELGSEKPVPKRDLSEVTCYTCRQKGHMSPNCPKRANKVKRVKVSEDQIVSLRRNEVFGSVGPHRMPVTCDTGAEITVVPAECVEPHQKTGEKCVLRSFNDAKITGECCTVDITVGDSIFRKKAVTQPGLILDGQSA